MQILISYIMYICRAGRYQILHNMTVNSPIINIIAMNIRSIKYFTGVTKNLYSIDDNIVLLILQY